MFLYATSIADGFVPTEGSWQEEYGGGNGEIVLLKLNALGTDLEWGSFYGGSGQEINSRSFFITGDNEIYFAGTTKSEDNIASEGAFQTELNYIDDRSGFIAKFTPCPGATLPTGEAEQEFQSGDSLDSLEVDFMDWAGSELIITWYADAEGTEVLSPGTVLEDGETYYVSQQIRGCEESGLLAITVTETMGIVENGLRQLSLYPNPNNGDFTIEGLLPNQETDFVLYNLLGKIVYKEITLPQTKRYILLLKDKLRPGIYLLKVSSLERQEVFRIVVEE